VLACVFTLLAVSACGGDDPSDDTSAADLTVQLPPAEELPIAGDLQLESEGRSEWDKALDFINLGVYRGAETEVSELVDAIQGEGFIAAVGESLGDENQETFTHIALAAFDSEDGAKAARDILHEEDLKQPCKKACIVAPVETTFDVPDSVAAHHKPTGIDPPDGGDPVEAYHIEFTIDSNLYVLQSSGSPDSILESNFEQAANAFYEHAAEQD
jgi:hypothetical protein